MQKLKNIFFIIFLFLILALSSSALCYTPWQFESADLRRAIANNSSPPARLSPEINLEPKNFGIIRRVRPYDNKKIIALTFDMCELDTSTSGCDIEILNFLRMKKIPATLFMGGKWMRTHEKRVRQIMLEPLFEIANHAWSHGNFALLSPEGAKAQILWTQAQYELIKESLIKEAEDQNKLDKLIFKIQEIPVLFRLPYGRSSERALNLIAETGLRVIQWDVAAEAGDNRNLNRAKINARRVAAMTRPGSILLFHANLVPKGSALLLKELVKILTERGYEFVTVSRLLELGDPEIVRDGYFSRPGDNKNLDKMFGIDGTGRRKRFTGKIN